MVKEKKTHTHTHMKKKECGDEYINRGRGLENVELPPNKTHSSLTVSPYLLT